MFNGEMDLSSLKNLDGYFEHLLIIGKEASKNEKWKEYAIFCFKREEGLKKEAVSHLDIFIKSFEKFSFKDKTEFVSFLFKCFEGIRLGDVHSFPYPLRKIVKDTLVDWCKVEKEDSNPFRWYGKFFRNPQYLHKALEINSSDDKSRTILIDQWIYALEYSCHHLPEGYIGDLNDDLALIEKTDKFINALNNDVSKTTFKKELATFKEIINNYQLWKESGEPNFEDWELKIKKGFL
ncbi:MAG: hypothetical protein LBU74_00175 [Methanobacteriaceae archaeon]|nr:hypothetical protein [Candidatus Methanorudis spinitermitis]